MWLRKFCGGCHWIVQCTLLAWIGDKNLLLGVLQWLLSLSWALTLAVMAAETHATGETERKKMGNTQCVCKEKEPEESFDLKLLWVSLYLACSCSLEDFWRSSRIQPWRKPPSDFQATSPVRLSVCGESSGRGAGTAVSLTDCLDWFLKWSTKNKASQMKCFPYPVVFVVM